MSTDLVRIVRVFLAGPSDVAEEIEKAKAVADSLNRSFTLDKGIRIEIVHWATHTFPSFGEDGQQLINEQIANMDDIDLFVGVMWNRFGSPTGRAESGTKEEFDRAVESFKSQGRPDIMFYFCDQPHSPRSPEESDQKSSVLRFRLDLQDSALIAVYEKKEDFGDLFRQHLEIWLVKRYPQGVQHSTVLDSKSSESQAVAAQVPLVESQSPESIEDSGDLVLIGRAVFYAEYLTETGEEIRTRIKVKSAEEDSSIRDLVPDEFGQSDLIPFAYQNRGAIVRIKSAKRQSSQCGDFWDLVIYADSPTGNSFEMGIGDMSPDQIAEKRARAILLNEKPIPDAKRRGGVLDQAVFEAFVTGIDTKVRAEGSVLPELWGRFRSQPDMFLRIARLWSVFHLITSECCERILYFKIGPIQNGQLQVSFRGRRRRRYVNVEPYVISVDGSCSLEH